MTADLIHTWHRFLDEAFPKINWGASHLGANEIGLMNEVCIKTRAAMADLTNATKGKGTAELALKYAMEEMDVSCRGDAERMDFLRRWDEDVLTPADAYFEWLKEEEATQ